MTFQECSHVEHSQKGKSLAKANPPKLKLVGKAAGW